MSIPSPVDKQIFRMLLEEEGTNLKELLDAEEYLVPQPNHFPRTHGNGIQSNGPSRHQSYRVSESSSHLFRAACGFNVFHKCVQGVSMYLLANCKFVLYWE